MIATSLWLSLSPSLFLSLSLSLSLSLPPSLLPSLSQVLVVVVRAHVSVCLKGSMNLNQAVCWWTADLSPSMTTPIYTPESLLLGKSRCSMLAPWLRTFLTIFKESAKGLWNMLQSLPMLTTSSLP